MNHRVIGFDLARAYAILGMFIVNFNFSFGSIITPTDNIGWFLSLFTGNSTAIFIICAGMGVSLISNKTGYNNEEKSVLKSKILKRSWFLFALGLLLYNWWEGDILHFYGGYMHIATFLLFIPKRYFIILSFVSVVVHIILFFIIPIDLGWDFTNYNYIDFWSPIGFLRNTIYNGWNSIFPWISYFLLGMWLGRLDWQIKNTKRNIFIFGLILFISIQILRQFAKYGYFSTFWSHFILAEYFPPFLPFMLVTTGFAFMVISICMYIGEKLPTNKFIQALQKTGQMTLSHYVIHLTLGMILFAQLFNKNYQNGLIQTEEPVSSIYILIYALFFFFISVSFSIFWSKKFKNGPLETLMRKISG